ncbi:MAG: hypothetical protein GY928_19770, partial [Colwellia sp.]|nr:hypothetical protein [Colwellia sp.]
MPSWLSNGYQMVQAADGNSYIFCVIGLCGYRNGYAQPHVDHFDTKTAHILLKHGHFHKIVRICSTTQFLCGSFIIAMMAVEKFSILSSTLNSLCQTHLKTLPNAAIEYAIVDQMRSSQRMSYCKPFFMIFITHYMHVSKNTTCTKTHRSRIYLGYLMMSCNEFLFDMIKYLSQSDIKTIVRQSCGVKKSKWLTHLVKVMKKWTRKDIFTVGQQNVLQMYKFMVTSHKRLNHILCCEDKHADFFAIFYVLGQVWSKPLGLGYNYDLANQYFVIATCIAPDIYHIVLSLKALSTNCYLNYQYMVGLKILRFVNKLCLETCSFPSLVQKHPKKRKIFKKRIAKLICFNCGSSGPGLRQCKG